MWQNGLRSTQPLSAQHQHELFIGLDHMAYLIITFLRETNSQTLATYSITTTSQRKNSTRQPDFYKSKVKPRHTLYRNASLAKCNITQRFERTNLTLFPPVRRTTQCSQRQQPITSERRRAAANQRKARQARRPIGDGAAVMRRLRRQRPAKRYSS